MIDFRIRQVAAYFLCMRHSDLEQNYPEMEYLSPEIHKIQNSAENFLNAYDDLTERLSALEDITELNIQTIFYDIGKQYYGEDQKILLNWFKDIYTILTGEERGPRIGTFVHIFGINEFITQMDKKINDPFELIAKDLMIKEWIEGHPELKNLGCSFTTKDYNLWKNKNI